MKNTFRLKVVQDLAIKASDDAALALGQLNAEVTRQEQKLEMLVQYREDYRGRVRSTVNQDVHTAAWMNLQQFLGKLDEAIEQQRSAVALAKAAVVRGQDDWQAKQVKVKAFDKLEQRHNAAADERMKKFEQRATDEFAARGHNAKG
ncbi:MAG TPA: flagellar export protein FliJ [Burkholderiales bacterium]|nr:flagellar export protein FliJ [Burkholderiales bacterium]